MPRIRLGAITDTKQASALGFLSLAALVLGGCSSCDEFAASDIWRPAIIAPAEAATPSFPRINIPPPPDCTVAGVEKPSPASGAPGAHADANLLEIARLEIERDCYKKVEHRVRGELERLQWSAQTLK